MTQSINDRLGPGGLENVAILSTVNGNTVLVGADGLPLSTLNVNIIPRSGALLDLLGVDGGNGEVSVATDWNAQVLHNGVADEATVLTCKPKSAQASLILAQAGIVTGTATKVAITGVVNDPHALFSGGADNHIVVPAGANRMKIVGGCSFAPHATGRRMVFPRLNGATLAGSYGNIGMVAVNSGTASENTNILTVVESAPCAPGDLITLWVIQHSGADMTLPVSSSTFLYAAFWRE